MPPTKKNLKKQRAEFTDDLLDRGDVTRDGATVCPFGEGLTCHAGCMVCDEGARCCSPGDTCYLTEQDTTNWCTGFRGGNLSAPSAPMPASGRSFWER